MDFRLPPDDDPRRAAIRRWRRAHPEPAAHELARAGYVAPHFPPPWGLSADPLHRLIIAEELADVAMPDNPIGIGWAAPTILVAGTDEQRDRYLWPCLDGSEYWCQLFSEPDAGSDLASLKTRADRDGDEYVITGQKIWTSYYGRRPDLGILLARTDSSAPRHEGISYFIMPMQVPGVEVRPIRQMTGEARFSEVFFTEARIPAANLVGVENGGWPLAKMTLGNERMSLSEGGVLWGMGPTTGDLVDLVRAAGPAPPLLRDRLAGLFAEAQVIRLLGYKILSDAIAGAAPGPEVAVKKFLADRHGQQVMETALELAGTAGLTGGGPLGTEPGEWPGGFLFSPALTIGGGTTQVLRNIIGERILGLPREPAV